ncbi:hypothetical protein GCM10027047_01220 [Rhodococcus aerolatus]
MSAATTAGVASLTEVQAREITASIRITIKGAWDLIVAAYQGRVWTALGYDSWDDYCENEFGGSRIRLPREERREVVSSLRDQGMSLRAIASATGQSEPTVRRDLAGASSDAPATERTAPPHVTDLITADDLAELNQPAPPRTTGTDGKSYRRPEPKGVGSTDAPAEKGEDPAPVLDGEVVEDPDATRRRADTTAEAKRAADHEAAMTDLYSGIARGLQIIGGYGDHADLPNLMAEFRWDRLSPPQYAREFTPENLAAAAAFISFLAEWRTTLDD